MLQEDSTLKTLMITLSPSTKGSKKHRGLEDRHGEHTQDMYIKVIAPGQLTVRTQERTQRLVCGVTSTGQERVVYRSTPSGLTAIGAEASLGFEVFVGEQSFKSHMRQ